MGEAGSLRIEGVACESESGRTLHVRGAARDDQVTSVLRCHCRDPAEAADGGRADAAVYERGSESAVDPIVRDGERATAELAALAADEDRAFRVTTSARA